MSRAGLTGALRPLPGVGATVRSLNARLLAAREPHLLADLALYGGVSAVALACDYGLLLGGVAFGLNYLAASAISFCVGMAVCYALSIRFVFSQRRAVSREAEAAGFFAVGVLGLALTQVLLFLLVSLVGLPVALAKIPTTALVFAFNFVCRRSFVFVGRQPRV